MYLTTYSSLLSSLVSSLFSSLFSFPFSSLLSLTFSSHYRFVMDQPRDEPPLQPCSPEPTSGVLFWGLDFFTQYICCQLSNLCSNTCFQWGICVCFSSDYVVVFNQAIRSEILKISYMSKYPFISQDRFENPGKHYSWHRLGEYSIQMYSIMEYNIDIV